MSIARRRSPMPAQRTGRAHLRLVPPPADPELGPSLPFSTHAVTLTRCAQARPCTLFDQEARAADRRIGTRAAIAEALSTLGALGGGGDNTWF